MRDAGTQRQACDEIKRATLAPRWVGKDFLLKPINTLKVESLGPGRKEHLEEFGEERLQQ
jgi:hypothetical protein